MAGTDIGSGSCWRGSVRAQLQLLTRASRGGGPERLLGWVVSPWEQFVTFINDESTALCKTVILYSL